MAEHTDPFHERWTPYEEAAYEVHERMIVDTLWWSDEAMDWRFRFEFRGRGDGHSKRLRRNNAWLDKQVRLHVSGRSKITNITGAIYLQADEDARRLFQALRSHTIESHGVRIVALQSRAVWLAAEAATAVLCAGYRQERLWRLALEQNVRTGELTEVPPSFATIGTTEQSDDNGAD